MCFILLPVVIGFTTLLIGESTATTNIDLCSNVANNMFLPYLNDCTKYNVCMNGTAVSQKCEEGFYFDAPSQSCTYQNEARCLPKCPSNTLTSYCYDRTCTKYVLCYAGIPVVRECIDGLQYNSETDRCDFAQYVDCVDSRCTIFNDPENIVYIASKAACEKFYICVDGHAHSQTCANGLQFNRECNCCDFPQNVNCNITTFKRNILPYSKAPPRRADIICPAEGAQFYAHKIRKDAYYYCLNGRGVTLDCTPGLIYDPKLETCREEKSIRAANLLQRH